MFSKLIYSSVVVGIVAGLVLSVGQMIWVNPIIFAAESYEVESPAPQLQSSVQQHSSPHSSHSAMGHHSVADDKQTDGITVAPWAPADGFERSGYTVAANISVGIGFAAVLLAIMSQLQSLQLTQVSMRQGIFWGLAGFISVFVAPGIGLPPEIPGIEAATVESRQGWWLLAAASYAIAFLLLSFAPRYFKLLALPLFALPYLVHIPHPQGPSFVHPDPQVVASLTDLHHSFIINSGATACAFWLALGIGCGFVINRWVSVAQRDSRAAV